MKRIAEDVLRKENPESVDLVLSDRSNQLRYRAQVSSCTSVPFIFPLYGFYAFSLRTFIIETEAKREICQASSTLRILYRTFFPVDKNPRYLFRK